MELDTIQSVIFKIKHSKAIHFKNILHAKKGRKTDKSTYIFFFCKKTIYVSVRAGNVV